MPGQAVEPGSRKQLAGSPRGPRFSAPPGQQRGPEQGGEDVGEHQMPARCQYPGALAQACPLIGPVIERGRADNQIEGIIGIGQPFGDTNCKPQPPVIGRPFGSPDHRWCGVDASEIGCLRAKPRQHPQQVPSATAYVEDALRRGMHRQSELGRPPGDVVMEATAPALLVTWGSLIEGGDITVRRHTGSLADLPPSDPCGSVTAWCPSSS